MNRKIQFAVERKGDRFLFTFIHSCFDILSCHNTGVFQICDALNKCERRAAPGFKIAQGFTNQPLGSSVLFRQPKVEH